MSVIRFLFHEMRAQVCGSRLFDFGLHRSTGEAGFVVGRRPPEYERAGRLVTHERAELHCCRIVLCGTARLLLN